MGFLRKYIFPILFGVIFFSLFKNHLPKLKVLSALETIDLLKKNDKLSLVRFGDGEFDIMGVSGFLCLGRLFQGQPNEAALCFL